jgi:GGDEF domain-containing protein
VANRIRETLANDGRKPGLSVSVGIAHFPTDGDKLDILLGVADAALYTMKAQVHRAAKGASRSSPSLLKGRA